MAPAALLLKHVPAVEEIRITQNSPEIDVISMTF